MGNISISKASNLYWLGRYAERVYRTIYYIRIFHDRMIDENKNAYLEFCGRLGLECPYQSREEFRDNYIFDNQTANSLFASMIRTLDLATTLRDVIGTETVSYVQMASNHLIECKSNQSVSDLYKVMDNFMAFWGSVDDFIIETSVRDMIKIGKYIERIDFFRRFDEDDYVIDDSINRLSSYSDKIGIGQLPDELTTNFNQLTGNYNSQIVVDYFDDMFTKGVEQ
jgi:uncharacterized alpha-E superfamily protein